MLYWLFKNICENNKYLRKLIISLFIVNNKLFTLFDDLVHSISGKITFFLRKTAFKEVSIYNFIAFECFTIQVFLKSESIGNPHWRSKCIMAKHIESKSPVAHDSCTWHLTLSCIYEMRESGIQNVRIVLPSSQP